MAKLSTEEIFHILDELKETEEEEPLSLSVLSKARQIAIENPLLFSAVYPVIGEIVMEFSTLFAECRLIINKDGSGTIWFIPYFDSNGAIPITELESIWLHFP